MKISFTSIGKYALLISILYLTDSGALWSQDILGMWQVTKVTVGEKEMTPVAKWISFEDEGYYRSGNGWLQIEKGSWSYIDGIIEVIAENAFGDSFGSFEVKVKKEEMTWKRMEMGQEVIVYLTAADEMPMSPADKIKGIWVLDKVKHNGKDITNEFDPEHKYYMLIRWDKIYKEGDVDGKTYTGYWFMHAHKPEFTIIPHGADPTSEAWNVEFPDDKLIMTGASPQKEGVVMTFSRSDSFPE